jgi:hypothetical protein
MSGTDREDWEERYGEEGLLFGKEPSRFLRDHLSLLPRGKALELAMGTGKPFSFSLPMVIRLPVSTFPKRQSPDECTKHEKKG